jgi:hypothetical protein
MCFLIVYKILHLWLGSTDYADRYSGVLFDETEGVASAHSLQETVPVFSRSLQL